MVGILLHQINVPALREAAKVEELRRKILVIHHTSPRVFPQAVEEQIPQQILLPPLKRKVNRIAKEVRNIGRFLCYFKSSNECFLVAILGYSSSCILQ